MSYKNMESENMRKEISIEEEMRICEEVDDEPSIISSDKIALSLRVRNFLRRALFEKFPFFLITHQDHDDSIELIIDEQEYIVLFRQEGVVVNAKSVYIYGEDELEDGESIYEFVSNFKGE